MNRAWVFGVGLAAGLCGCVGTTKNAAVQGRSQVGDDPAADKELYATVGQKTAVGNTEAIPVVGVGLVYKLQGTGSSAPAGGWRTQLENNLKKQGFTNLRELLDDPGKTTSLVLVTAVIPPGARKGDPLDVQIGLPDESRTTSLKGGVLLACELVNTDTTNNVRDAISDGTGTKPAANALLAGSVMAKAEGPVVAGAVAARGSARGQAAGTTPDADDPDAPPKPDDDHPLRAGRVWNGAKSHLGRPYYLLLNPGEQTTRTAMQIAERLNATFHSGDGQKLAEAKTRELVVVNVPPAYRHAHYRFLLAARQVPLTPVELDSSYRTKLDDELLDPATTLTAAVKLEALGADSKRALRVGLESPSPWVRFASAEALSYLGFTDGAAELARLAEHPALRAHCLKALASVDDAASTDRLVDLMGSADPQLRFGAFLTLQLADAQNVAVRGQVLNHSLKLHRVAPGSGGLIHLTSDGKGEVVVFGDTAAFKGPFTLPLGSDFSVTMKATGDQVSVSRVVRVKGDADVKTLTVPADVPSVLTAVATLGGGHPEAVELLRRAERAEVLTAPLVVDAIPRQFGIDRLVAFAKTDPTLYKADKEVARVGTVGQSADDGHDLPGGEEKPEPVAAEPERHLAKAGGGAIFRKRKPPAESAGDDLPKPLPEPADADDAVTPASATTPPRHRGQGSLFGPRK